LNDAIELIQVLCELYDVNLPYKVIADLIEYTLRGSITKITNCYLLDKEADIKTVLEQGNTRKVIDVTKEMKKVFSEHWEHKQLFIGNTTFNKVLNKKYLKKSHKLLICYKHLSKGYYRVLEYDGKGILVNILNTEERIELSKEEFIDRMKSISLLMEAMRIQVSLNNVFVSKTIKNLKVSYSGIYKLKVNFAEELSECCYTLEDNLVTIKLPPVHTEDTLLEIQSRIVDEVRKLEESKELNLELNFDKDHSLQFFNDNISLNIYSRLGVRVIMNIGTQ
jgi:hypothetical protein